MNSFVVRTCKNEEKGYLLFSRYQRYLLLPAMLYPVDKRLSIFCAVSMFVFLRNPIRKATSVAQDTITSPADGTILRKEKRDGKFIVSIFLSIFDVHVQYAPINGKVVEQRYVKGRFHPAYIMEKSDYNERLYTDIMTLTGQIVTVVQIAGQVATRIESFVKTGDNVSRGCHLGIIKFGSRVDIIVPANSYAIAKDVKVGDSVVGGVTPLLLGQK